MIRSSLRRLAMAEVPLRFDLLLVFLAVLVPLSAAIIGYNYYAAYRQGVEEISRRVDVITQGIVERQERFMEPATAMAGMLARHYANVQVSATKAPEFAAPLLAALVYYPQIYGMYVGYESGEFAQVVRFSKRELQHRKQFGIPEGARFAVRKIVKSGEAAGDTWQFLDENHAPVATETRPIKYDPRIRPWYVAARKTDEAVSTEPYTFFASRQPGMTFAQRLNGRWKGAAGVDITLSDLSDYIARQQIGKSGHILIFTNSGTLLAATPGWQNAGAGRKEEGGASKGGTPVLGELMTALVQMMAAGNRDQVNATIGGVEYLVNTKTMQLGENVEFRVVALASVKEFLDPVRRISIDTAGLSFGFGLLAIPLIFLLARRISRPIVDLAEDARRIQQLNLEPASPIPTSVKEVHTLAESFDAMKSTLNRITKYVPKAQVSNLIASTEDPIPGGEKRTISMLFTDIQDFTPLTEAMSPDDIVRKSTTYFSELGRAILASGGQIGRFMGDGLVAYWNAPNDHPDHAACAAEAVLRARSDVRALNERWRSYGWPIMYTRFGLHFAEAIVGNLGLPDRMDYTLIGGNVNIASRLEGLNKFYGTQILVSGAMAEELSGRFALRWVDRAMAKGSSQTLEVFELVGMLEGDEFVRPSPLQVEMAALWNQEVGPAYLERKWDAAQKGIARYAEAFPADQLAQIYATRCRDFKKHPPPKDWDGVVHYDQK